MCRLSKIGTPLHQAEHFSQEMQDMARKQAEERAQVIDVCEPAEFAAAHVAGAKNVPLGEIAAGKGLPGNKKLPLVVVCAAGKRSAQAVAQLKQMGYENAQSLSGGLKAWREANLPVDTADKA